MIGQTNRLTEILTLYTDYRASHIILDYVQSLTPKYVHYTKNLALSAKKVRIVLLNFSKCSECPPNRNLDPLTRSNFMWGILYVDYR